MLLSKVSNVLTKRRETEVIDTYISLRTSKEEAATANPEAEDGDEVIMAKIMSIVDIVSEAGRQNIAQQAAIGTKEGPVTGISKHVTTNVTDSVLHEAQGRGQPAEGREVAATQNCH